jgi:hypothetical protein
MMPTRIFSVAMMFFPSRVVVKILSAVIADDAL